MKTIMLNGGSPKLLENYLLLVPGEFRGYCEDNNAILIGTMEEEDDGLVATGITIIAADNSGMTVKWLWVDPNYRYQGAGSMLLETAFEIAGMNDLDRLKVQVPALGSESFYETEAAGFFDIYSFTADGKAEADGLEVFNISAPADGALSADKFIEKEQRRLAELETRYATFPDNFKVEGVEFM